MSPPTDRCATCVHESISHFKGMGPCWFMVCECKNFVKEERDAPRDVLREAIAHLEQSARNNLEIVELNHKVAIADMQARIADLVLFARMCATDFDHEQQTREHQRDGESYGGVCRTCAAERLLHSEICDTCNGKGALRYCPAGYCHEGWVRVEDLDKNH